MQMVKNIFIGFFVIWFALLVFMPKQELYFTLEKALVKHDIEINEQNIEEGVFSLNLTNPVIYVKGIKIASIEKINISTFIFTTNINIKLLMLDDSLQSFVPEKIDDANISYSLFSPFKVNIEAKGSFGLINGHINLNEKSLRLDFTETTKEIEKILKKMTKDGIMKHLFKSKFFKKLFTVLIIFALVKLLWFTLELVWLSPSGIGHDDEVSNKSLYYRVKLTPNEAPAPIRKQPQKIAGSIKDISLLAIYNSENTTVITVEYKRKSKVLARGDKINGFTLEGAGSNFATFSKDAKTYSVDLSKSKKNSSSNFSIKSAIKTSTLPSKEPVKVEGEVTDAGDHKIIDRSLIDHYAKNMDDIYKNIGISEVKEDGKIKGFRITFVRRGSPFSKLGIKRGDVIKSINGQEITSYNAAFETYKNIQNIENLTMVIKRGKEEMELEYEIN